MIHTKDHKTGYLFDPWDHMGPKRRKLMEQSWAGLFREHILQELPVNKIAPYFTEGFGRPTKEFYMALGVIILQQAYDITDDETLCQWAFSEQWHYALDITSPSDNATYMSPKTLWNMRKIVTNNEIKSADERGLAPDELLADSLYGSNDNCETAKKRGTEVIAPTMGSQKEDTIPLSDFTFSEKGKVISCPEGHAPVGTKHKKNRHTAAFKINHCSNCPKRDKCPVKAGKKHYHLRYEDKAWRIAMRRAYEQNEKFKDKYRWRADVEATMSEYDRKTGVKNLRVRGMKAVRLCATLKAVGINIFRATAFRRAKISPKPIRKWACWCVARLCFYVKEPCCALLSNLGKMFSESTFSTGFSCISAS